MERRKGRNMAKATRPRQRHGHPVRLCAWCTHPVHGDAVTVTFPDKAQVTFHVACLDQYRAVMWPWAGAVGTAAAAPPRSLASALRRERIMGRVEDRARALSDGLVMTW